MLLVPLIAAWPALTTPPVQTRAQKVLYDKQNAAAAMASAAATPAVLNLLSQPEFRSGLAQCCSDVASLPSEDLLSRFREEILVAELAHNFPSSPSGNGSHWLDETLDTMQQYPWFLNQWQAKLIPHEASRAIGDGNRVELFDPRRTSATRLDMSMSDAEVGIFGCAPFAAGPDQPTWDEAADRLIYVALNLRQRDTGNSDHFGEVSAIFRRSSVDPLVLIAPVDTGIWEGSCNATDPANPWKDLNCSYWASRTVGTFEHFDHLILGNTGTWSGGGQSGPARTLANQTARLFARTALSSGGYAALPALESSEVEAYWESNVVGNPRLEAISFLIGTFGALFGTGAGRSLQSVATSKGWPVVWALGAADAGGHSSKEPASWPANKRLLDPTTGNALTNRSTSTTSSAAFEQLWQQASEARAQLPPGQPPSVDTVQGWWKQLEAAQLVRLAPLTARACSDVDKCIGTVVGDVEDDEMECVCTM